ncbi:MAG: MarR family transcriptional regulator [Bacilli bacterium]|nr:MarR family transcriptional regulator [Bacilli bacterium]
MNNESILRKIKKLEHKISCKLGTPFENQPRPTRTQMQIMEYMLEHKDEIILQRDLEEILNTSRATVSSVLKTMEKYKLIDRVTDETDTRTKRIKLNEESKKIFEENKKKFAELESQLIKDIDPKELDIFLKVLNKMKDNI